MRVFPEMGVALNHPLIRFSMLETCQLGRHRPSRALQQEAATLQNAAHLAQWQPTAADPRKEYVANGNHH